MSTEDVFERNDVMIPQRVSLITIGANDMPSLRSFYQRLGWSETSISSDNYAVFATAGVLLSLYPIEDLLRDLGKDRSELTNGFKGMTFAINVDRREEVDYTIGKIRTAGGQIIRLPHDAFWGGRIAYFMDPEENIWEVAWNPTALFDERGAMISF
ncbi:VOC family protein [Paenibacillus abyssi]|uniref:Glyoxalase n=1 Tax=Paenibacillus abyssi TaxID=1340531 RepID=A0A917LDR6_9BACL|nr:VOC family protein [Paenibacillus abyssi]GGG15141.1 glyoxalase [Paenibacillus abyssi]